MMKQSALSLICIVILFTTLSSCASAPSGVPNQIADNNSQVVLQSEIDGQEDVQEFDLDNCDGKADATRTEHRVSSIDVTVSTELAAKIGASAEVISAEIQASVGAALKIGGERGTSIELTAPPNTHMFFQLAWGGKSQVGVVQNVKGSGIPVTFRSFMPNNVRIKSQYDMGCRTSTPSAPSAPAAPAESPAANIPPAPTPAEVPIQDTPDGTILGPGMAWYKNGKSILLNNYSLTSYAVANGEAVNVEWIVKNVSTHSISIKFTEDDFKASNNIGQNVTYKRFYDLPNGNGSTVSFAPSDSLKFSIDLWIVYSDPSVNMVTVSVSLSDIQNARWNIPVYH